MRHVAEERGQQNLVERVIGSQERLIGIVVVPRLYRRPQSIDGEDSLRFFFRDGIDLGLRKEPIWSAIRLVTVMVLALVVIASASPSPNPAASLHGPSWIEAGSSPGRRISTLACSRCPLQRGWDAMLCDTRPGSGWDRHTSRKQYVALSWTQTITHRDSWIQSIRQHEPTAIGLVGVPPCQLASRDSSIPRRPRLSKRTGEPMKLGEDRMQAAPI